MSIVCTDSVAVIIDPWYTDDESEEIIFKEIADFCVNHPYINAILVANYNNSDNPSHDFLCYQTPEKKRYYLSLDERLHDNAQRIYLKQYCANAPVDINRWWITMNLPIEQFNYNDQSLELIERYGPFYPDKDSSILSPTILNMPIRSDQTILPVWTKSQLEYLINTHWPNTRNIYVMGGAWSTCVRNRMTGYLSIADSIVSSRLNPQTNILVKAETIFGHSARHIDISEYPAWEAVLNQSDIFLYNKDKEKILDKEKKIPWIREFVKYLSAKEKDSSN